MRLTIQNFNNGKQEGRSFWYHPNGSIGWEENYENGIAHGTFRYYDETGQLRIEKTYEKGKEVSYLFDGKDLKNNYWKEVSEDYTSFREKFLNKKNQKRYISFQEAKKNNLKI